MFHHLPRSVSATTATFTTFNSPFPSFLYPLWLPPPPSPHFLSLLYFTTVTNHLHHAPPTTRTSATALERQQLRTPNIQYWYLDGNDSFYTNRGKFSLTFFSFFILYLTIKFSCGRCIMSLIIALKFSNFPCYYVCFNYVFFLGAQLFSLLCILCTLLNTRASSYLIFLCLQILLPFLWALVRLSLVLCFALFTFVASLLMILTHPLVTMPRKTTPSSKRA